jgi:two-component system, OmpR family, sensor histidine kinase BaeS
VQSRLLWKLLGIHLLSIGVVFLIVWMAIDYLAADYFMVLMRDYNVSPTDVHTMFLDATHWAIIWATLLAAALALVLSFLLTRKVLTPLSQITRFSKKIAAGDYTDQVSAASKDEIGQLATAFNQMAKSLQRLENLRKAMVADVAHELRTPLTNMRGYIEALRDSVLPPSKETFESLHEEIIRLAKLVEDLLQLARADAARKTLSPQRVDLAGLLRQGVDLFKPKLVEKNIHLQFDLPDANFHVSADPEALARVVANLLENACRYAPEGGQVRIRAEGSTDRLKVVFVNSGEGIPEGDLPFIFERFYRGEKSRSRDHGGAGIGLAVVKELVEAHRGEVGAESSPAETRVWFTLRV